MEIPALAREAEGADVLKAQALRDIRGLIEGDDVSCVGDGDHWCACGRCRGGDLRTTDEWVLFAADP